MVRVLNKKQMGFHSAEMSQILLTGLFVGIFLSLKAFGVEFTEIDEGFAQLIPALISVLIILFTITIAQKALGVFFGYKITYIYSWFGLLIGFFVTFFSAGLIPFFLPGGLKYDLIKRARIGKYLAGRRSGEMFTIASLAVVIPMFFALIFGGFFVTTEYELFRHITITALLFGLYALLPVPLIKPISEWGSSNVTKHHYLRQLSGGTYGYDLFSFQSVAYVLLGLTFLVFAGLILIFQVFSIMLSLLLAFLILFVYRFVVRTFH